MRIEVHRFTSNNVLISMEAETQAEQYQLRALKNELFDTQAHCIEWDNMEGRHGISIVAENIPKQIGAPDVR